MSVLFFSVVSIIMNHRIYTKNNSYLTKFSNHKVLLYLQIMIYERTINIEIYCLPVLRNISTYVVYKLEFQECNLPDYVLYTINGLVPCSVNLTMSYHNSFEKIIKSSSWLLRLKTLYSAGLGNRTDQLADNNY